MDKDSDLREQGRVDTDYYIRKNDNNIISDKEFEKLLKDDSNNFELIDAEK